VPEPELTASVQRREAFEEAVRSQADELLEALLGELGETVSGVEVRQTVVEDRHPAEALVQLSVDADLLVVGSRGRGGFPSCCLGRLATPRCCTQSAPWWWSPHLVTTADRQLPPWPCDNLQDELAA
jgi:hypothetical protein